MVFILTLAMSTIGWTGTYIRDGDISLMKSEAKPKSTDATKTEKCCKATGAQQATAGCQMDCADSLCSSKMNSLDNKHPAWILSSLHEEAFSLPLVEFASIYGRFPNDIAEFIESGLPLAWPADPETGKPLRIFDTVRPRKEDMGKIAYIRKSDCEAHFETVIPLKGDYAVYQFPCCKKARLIMADYQSSNTPKDIIREDSFERTMSDLLSMASQRIETSSKSEKKTGFRESMKNNFFLIKNNLKPQFISADPKKALYFERGLATLDGKSVKFEEYSVKSLDEKGKQFLDHYYWVEPLFEKNVDLSGDDTAWNRLTGKEYFYSTRLMLTGDFVIPSELQMTREQILNG